MSESVRHGESWQRMAQSDTKKRCYFRSSTQAHGTNRAQNGSQWLTGCCGGLFLLFEQKCELKRSKSVVSAKKDLGGVLWIIRSI
jgi:hypothetical protein